MNLAEFKDLMLRLGTVAKFNDGQFLGQCVSLINQYCYRVLNIPAGSWGHAKDWATNPVQNDYFNKVGDIKPGDILVYGSNYGDGLGHIEIALENGQALFQNRNGNGRVGTGKQIANPIAILRSKKVTPSGGNKMIEDNESEYQRLWLKFRRLQGSEAAARFTREDFKNYVGQDRVTIDDIIINTPQAAYRERAGDVGDLAIKHDWWNRLVAVSQKLEAAGSFNPAEVEKVIKEAEEALDAAKALKQ